METLEREDKLLIVNTNQRKKFREWFASRFIILTFLRARMLSPKDQT